MTGTTQSCFQLIDAISYFRASPQNGYDVVGVPDPDKPQSDLASQCATTFNRPLRPTIQSEVVDGRVVVAAFIDEAPAGEKPIYIKSTGVPGGAYRRIGANSPAQHRAWGRKRDSRDPGCNRRRPWRASWLALAQSDSPPLRPGRPGTRPAARSSLKR